MSALLSSGINIVKMLWNSCMCIKAVNDIKHLCKPWCLNW